MNAADAAAEVVSHAAAVGVVRKVTPEKLEAGKGEPRGRKGPAMVARGSEGERGGAKEVSSSPFSTLRVNTTLHYYVYATISLWFIVIFFSVSFDTFLMSILFKSAVLENASPDIMNTFIGAYAVS